MLFFYYGADFEKRNSQKNKMLDILKKKRPDSTFLKVTEEEFSESFIKENLSAAGLFDDKNIFEINGVFGKKENEDLFCEYVKDLENSENAFVFVEDKISAKTKKLLEKNNIKEYGFDKKELKTKDVNVFGLTDLFLKRDRKKVWVEYQSLINSGVSEEEIFGILFWAVKTINIINSSNDIKETSLKPFVYSKNKKNLDLWEENELKKLMARMIDIYHGSRRGLYDFKTEVEKIILG